MKRFFLIALVLTLLFTTLLCSCSFETADREGELKEILNTTYEALTDTFSESDGQYSMVAEYLNSWAEENDLKVKSMQEHAIVLRNSATKDCKDAESTVLQCSIDSSDFKHSLETLAIGMTALLGPESHGKISLIVTEANGGQMIGAEAVDAKYCKGDNFINLQYRDKTKLYTSGAESFTATMTASLERTEPSYSKAYSINMSIPQYIDAFNFDGHYPNPIETIGSLLASAKSSGRLFQLASFSCETQNGYVPSSATAVVVIDENNVEAFLKRFDKSYENVEKKFKKLDDDFVYTMTETSMPDTVISTEYSDNIISLMYTMKTGIYQQDEDSGRIISAADTASVSTKDDQFKITFPARSLDSDVLNEMSTVFLTISGLCDIQYQDSDPEITWTSNDTLSQFFMEALQTEEDESLATLKHTECDLFYSKVPNLNIISYQTDIDAGEDAMLNLVHYMEHLTAAEQK